MCIWTFSFSARGCLLKNMINRCVVNQIKGSVRYGHSNREVITVIPIQGYYSKFRSWTKKWFEYEPISVHNTQVGAEFDDPTVDRYVGCSESKLPAACNFRNEGIIDFPAKFLSDRFPYVCPNRIRTHSTLACSTGHYSTSSPSQL